MIPSIFTVVTLVSTILFPWPLTLLLTFVTALKEPLLPLAVGLFADTLYYAPEASLLPIYTLLGALGTILALFVRTRLNTSSMER